MRKKLLGIKTLIAYIAIALLLVACNTGGTTSEEDPAPTAAPSDSGESGSDSGSSDSDEVIIGLITKTETNPFFVKMKEGAQAKADELGATLLTAAGTFDGDNESQVTAIENMTEAGAQGILITPSDTSAIVPAIEKAREAGVIVIALDTPTDPEDATTALYATDNFKAGLLIGEYARSVKGDDEVKIALLNLAPGITVGQLRRDGFVQGYGINDGDPQIVCEEDTRGDQAMGQTAMENCLTVDPDIDVVYTINEPAAFGAYTALENAGRADDVLIVSVDGGCAGVEGINDGRIAATSQQYPLRMASLGVETVVDYAKTGNAPSGYTDTGVTLITNDSKFSGTAENGVFGIESCWGEPSASAMDDAKAAVAAAGGSMDDGEMMDEIIIGLITKTETNPFFVKMKEGAQAKADEIGATLLTAAGTFDGDNEAQVTAIENMVAAGAQGILITPSDTSAIVPAIEKARAEGVMVIALDTPTDPEDATDALFATDNFKAGVLIGEYARSVMGDDPVKIAMLDLAPGITVGQLRHDGFLEGYGISQSDSQIVCEEDTRGDQAMGQTAMENCLTVDPDINVVYTINEPAAFGAYTALENAGRADDVLILSVDGGCSGVEGVNDGRIGATSQQYPLQMASLGVEAIADFAKTGNKVSGYTDTGVTLITNDGNFKGDAENGIFGIESCWGEPSDGAMDAAESAVAAAGGSMDDGEMMDEIIIGLITKTETNPFFVKMKEGAQAKADEMGATLLTAAGTFDGDNESQVTAIENMVAAGAQGILITPSDTSAIVPAIEKARAEGVMVIALDTPTDPEDATDALFATDNFKAGVLIGEYARSVMGDDPVKIAMLDLAPGITVGQLRHDGFLEGYGISQSDSQIVCEEDTRGDQAMGQTAMENCLTVDPDINVVYTINEPAAFGAYTALENAGRADDVLILSVDGGCSGVEGVNDGRIGATSQQYPLQMASLGVEAVVNFAKTGERVSGYTDTGVTLITNDSGFSGEAEDGIFGVENCWGEPSDGAMEKAEEAVAMASDGMMMDGEIIIGLITKTETNPFFVKMKEGAQAKADELGATLLTAAGTFDGDNESQVTAIENMIAAGAQGILITPSDTAAIVPAIEKARDAGLIVIALDTPTDPEDATNALFATDNYKAGILIGEYARATMGDDPVKIALLNLAPGITVGQLRRDGFVTGYGIEDGDPQIVCEEDTRGDQAMGQTAMENCLTVDPDINVVYTINEPAAFGAYTALVNAGRADDVLIVSVDGGCAGVRGVVSGEIGATSQQYPLQMASLGVESIVAFAKTGDAPSGYTDTGVTLITDSPVSGLASVDSAEGLDLCWGE